MARDRLLEDAAVPEADELEALLPGTRVQLVDALEEARRILELVEHEREHGLIAALRGELARDRPQRQEPIVEHHDLAEAIDHEDAVRGRLEDGPQ